MVGLVLGASEFSGDFGDGGDFQTDSRRAIVYASFALPRRAFMDGVVEYSMEEFERRR